MELPSLRKLNIMNILAQMLFWAAFAALTGYQTALLLNRGFSSGEAGIFASLRCLAGIIAQPLLGGWADRHPNVPLGRILNVCLAAALVVNVLFALTRPNFWGTALIFLALGVLELNAYPLIDAMAVQFISAGMNVNYSLGRGFGSLSYAITGAVLGYQSARFGVESVLVTHGILVLLLMAVIGCYPQVGRKSGREKSQEDQPHSVWYILRTSKSFSFMLVAVFLSMTAVKPAASFLVNIIESKGGSEVHLGTALFLMASMELATGLFFPTLKKHIRSSVLMAAAVFFMALKPVLFFIAPTLGWLLAAQPIQMFGNGLFNPASVYYANENVSPADRVRGQTIMMMVSSGMGGMVGNLIAGYAIDWGGVDRMLVLMGGIGFVGFVLAVVAVIMDNNRRNSIIMQKT